MEDVEPDSSQEDEVGPRDGGGFNQTRTETTIMEEMALQIELESDKNNIRSEQGLGLDEELLHPDQINAEEEEEAGDNKITEETLQQAANRADSRQGELQHSAFYGISLGGIYKLRKQKIAIMWQKPSAILQNSFPVMYETSGILTIDFLIDFRTFNS